MTKKKGSKQTVRSETKLIKALNQLSLKTASSQKSKKRTKSRQRNALKKALPSGAIVSLDSRSLQMRQNTYLDSLLDPQDSLGVKIPDLVSFPTSTFQVVIDGTISTGSATSDGVLVCFNPWNWISNNSATLGDPYTYVANTSVGGVFSISTGYPYPNGATINNLYDNFRVVSACLYAEFIGPSISDGGQICFGQVTRWNSFPTSFTSAITYPYTMTLPVREGCKVVLKPVDNLDLEFVPTNFGVNLTSAQSRSGLFFCTSGMAVSTPIRYRLVANYEAIPSVANMSLVNASPGPIKPSFVESAFEWMSHAYSNVSPFISKVSPYVSDYASSYVQGMTKKALTQGLASAGSRLLLGS